MHKDAARSRNRAAPLSDLIEDDILTGVFAAGERLDEARLAQRYEVSRTPVREALRQLASSGMIDLRPNRGAFVMELSATELVEMFEVMAELEGMCGRLAARRLTPDRHAALLERNAACLHAETHGNEDAYYYANEAFHQEIYAASRNGFLERQAIALHKRLKPYRRLQLRNPGRVTTSSQEHQRILDAICAGDEAGAEKALKSHIMIQGSRFSEFLAALERRPGPRERTLSGSDG